MMECAVFKTFRVITAASFMESDLEALRHVITLDTDLDIVGNNRSTIIWDGKIQKCGAKRPSDALSSAPATCRYPIQTVFLQAVILFHHEMC